MSNGAIAAACCCTEECETDCCSWWSCSPAGPITVTLSGSAIVERKILPSATPTTLIVKEVYWTITATMTKSGTTCVFSAAGAPSLNWPNLFRFSATQVDFSYQRIERTYDVGGFNVCRNFCPPQCCTADYTESGCITNVQGGFSNTDPCACGTDLMCDDPIVGSFASLAMSSTNPCVSWNCGSAMGANCADGEVTGDNIPVGCTDCDCPQTVDDIVFKLIETKEWNWTGTILSAGSCATDCASTCNANPCDRGPLDDLGVDYPLTQLARPGHVLTIACVEGYCKKGCAKPVLVFRPGFQGATGSGTYERWSGDPVNWPDNRDPCCVDCETGDDSACYSSVPWTPCITNFAVLGKGNCLNSTSFDAPILGCDSHPEPVFNNVFCTGGDDMAGKGGCQPCSALTGTFPENEYCPPTGKGTFYFCATAGVTCYVPCGDPNGQLVTFPGTVCYWPSWCESDERTIQWTWSL